MNNLLSVIMKNSKRRELTNRSVILSKISFFIVFGFLSVIMIIFSIIATVRLAEMKQTYAFINMLLFMNFVIVFTESIFHSLNTLYFSNDLKIFLRLPIKPKDLVDSKMIDMIYSEYQMEILMLAIPIIVYGLISKVSLLFYLYMIVILLILPIIPIAFTTLIVALIMRFTNFMKNKNKVMYTTIILAVLIVGLFMTNLGSGTDLSVSTFERLILQANGLAEEFSNSFILIKPIMNVLLNYDNINGLINLLVYMLETLVVYKLAVFIVSRIYLKGAIGTIVNGQKDKRNIKALTIKDLKKNRINKTYILKELKIMLRTPIFFIECILMPILYPILVLMAVVFLVKFAQGFGIDVMNLISQNAKNANVYSFFLATGQALFMLNFSSIIGVSKESRSSVLMKTLPIDLDRQFKLKTRIGIISNMISILIICIIYYYCTYNWLYTTMLFIGLFLINMIGEKYKLLVDLNNPQIKWDTEYTMMKQNTNVMYELFYTIIVIAIIVIIGSFTKSMRLFITMALVLLIIVNSMINKYIAKKKDIIFGKLY